MMKWVLGLVLAALGWLVTKAYKEATEPIDYSNWDQTTVIW